MFYNMGFAASCLGAKVGKLDGNKIFKDYCI